MNDDRLLNLKEAAKLLHSTPGTLRAFIAARKIAEVHNMPYGRGSLRLYHESTVRGWAGSLAVFKKHNTMAGVMMKQERRKSQLIAAALAKAPTPAITPAPGKPMEVIPYSDFEAALTDALGAIRLEAREHNRLLLNAITRMTERFERIAADLGIKPN